MTQEEMAIPCVHPTSRRLDLVTLDGTDLAVWCKDCGAIEFKGQWRSPSARTLETALHEERVYREQLSHVQSRCTSFRLGKEDDDNHQSWVCVARVYNDPRGVKWHVERIDVSTEPNVHDKVRFDTQQHFITQEDALAAGHVMLAEIRKEPPS